jgi:hypothetical protein
VNTLPWIHADFYGAVTPDKKRAELSAILKGIGDLPPKDRLVPRGSEYADYLEITNILHGQIFGGAAKIRKTDHPNRFNLKTLERHTLGISTEDLLRRSGGDDHYFEEVFLNMHLIRCKVHEVTNSGGQ